VTIENALVTEVITIRPEETVKTALALMDISNIRALPVVDENGDYIGMFSTHQLLKKLLPHIATTENNLPTLDFIQHAAPQIAQKLRELEPLKMGDVVDRSVPPIFAGIPHTEAMMRLVRHGSPVPVVHKGTSRFHGLLTEQSMLEELQKIGQV